MKRNIFLALMMLFVSCALLLLVSNCGKPEKTKKADTEITTKLVHQLNEIPGLTIKVEPANMAAKSSEKNRYLIILKDPTITFDISGFNIAVTVKNTKIPIKIKEMVLLYGPKEKYLELVSGKEISFDWDFSKLMQTPGKTKKEPGLPEMSVKLSMGNITFRHYDVSPLLNTKAKGLMELVGQLLEKNKSLNYTVENMSYEVRFTQQQENLSFLIEAEKLAGYQGVLTDIFISLYKKGGEAPNFSNALNRGTALIDLGMTCSLFKLSAKKNECLLGKGTVDHLDLSYFLKPDQTNSFFTYGFTWAMKNLRLSIPGNHEIELAGHIHEWGMNFSLQNLSPAFVQAYLDLVNKSIALSAAQDKEKLRQQQMMMGITIASEFMKTKPIIKCSISPFKHYFGELAVEFNFQFLNLMAPPVGKAAVKITKIKDILTKIKEEKSLSPKTVQVLSQLVTKYVIMDENGNGIITFETKKDQPGKFFLNDKAMMK